MEEYIKTLLEQVRCKKAHSMIEEEIRGHIEEQTEANIASGMTEEEAIKEAVKDMGSPVEAGISLDRIHRPQMAWNMVIVMAVITIISIVIHALIGKDGLGSSKFAFYSIVGFLIMLGVYRIDYSFMAKYAKVIAGAFILYLVAMNVGNIGVRVNGVNGLRIAGVQISTFAVMMLYIPVYGAVLYQYYGSRWAGIFKALVWMVLPMLLTWELPCASLVAILFISMAAMLSIAVGKGWFQISKKGFYISFWGTAFVLPILVVKFATAFGFMVQYQIIRMKSFLGGDESCRYLANRLQNSFRQSKWVGAGSADSLNYLSKSTDFNSSYILAYLTSSYGIMVCLLVCCILAILVVKSFRIALKQKNQLGMLMGCGCGMVFVMNIAINVLENTGVLPAMQTFLPFFSAGGSFIIVSYVLIGMILSIYRYKNIHPRRFKKVEKEGKICL